mgnify:FL=1
MTVKEEANLEHGLSRVNYPYVDCLFDKIFKISSLQLMSRPL